MWRVIWFSDKNSTSDSVSFAETITWWTTWDLKVRLKQIHPKNCQYQVQGCLTQTPGLLGLPTCASLRPVLWIEIVTRFWRECKVAAAFLQGTPGCTNQCRMNQPSSPTCQLAEAYFHTNAFINTSLVMMKEWDIIEPNESKKWGKWMCSRSWVVITSSWQ